MNPGDRWDTAGGADGRWPADPDRGAHECSARSGVANGTGWRASELTSCN
jgi:hypothetical protein